jgi:hypothetical protein
VLFSSDEVAKFINEEFEPAWESVRPVPLVTIDFGNGHTITRTVNGNIATQVTNAEGQVLDILPGVYTADVYLKQLGQLVLLHRYVVNPGRYPGVSPEERLKSYHEQQATQLAKDEPPGELVLVEPRPGGIIRVEATVHLMVRGRAGRVVARRAEANPPVPAGKELAGWKELAEDTRINETVRRLAIHKKLAAAGKVEPKDITRWLYKDILKADLDDPYLGLTDVLNKQYPFVTEEEAAKKR